MSSLLLPENGQRQSEIKIETDECEKEKEKKHKGGRMDMLHNLLRGHPEWNLSGPICQITNSFDSRI